MRADDEAAERAERQSALEALLATPDDGSQPGAPPSTDGTPGGAFH
jgi:hypothetical protein